MPLALLAASPCHGAQAQRTAGQSSGPPLGPALKALVAYGALVAASVAVLAQACSLLPPGLAATLDRVQLLPAGLQQAVPQPGGPSEAPFAWVGARAAQQSPFQPPSPLLPAAGLQPGLGLHWYLLAQAFPRFR